MNTLVWQQKHLQELQHRFDALRALPDGILTEQTDGPHHIQIVKHKGQIFFYFIDAGTGDLVGPMSRLALDTPLHLLAEYTQSAMLTLLWRPQPARICLLGLAGGRLSLLFYHLFPEMLIDNIDVDPTAATIASTYFGLTFDERQRLTLCDARAFLHEQAVPNSYDIVVMDAFSDSSDDLDHLATCEFYADVRRCLVRDGVLAVNLLKSDQHFFEKAKTLLESFRHVLVAEYKRSMVMFGSDQRAPTEIRRRAEQLQRRHNFSFPFVERAMDLQLYRTTEAAKARPLREVSVLRDA
jgi:spermidine synthase